MPVTKHSSGSQPTLPSHWGLSSGNNPRLPQRNRGTDMYGPEGSSDRSIASCARKSPCLDGCAAGDHSLRPSVWLVTIFPYSAVRPYVCIASLLPVNIRKAEEVKCSDFPPDTPSWASTLRHLFQERHPHLKPRWGFRSASVL